LEPVRTFSPFFQYSGHDPLRTGMSGTALAASLASTLVLTVMAVWAFRRRDIAT
jgi:ABC-2 type transport system permease protein